MRRLTLLALTVVLSASAAGCGLQEGVDRAMAPTRSFAGCSAYATHAEAQRDWERSGEPGRYDGDGDGVVCERLLTKKGSAGKAKTKDCRRVDRVVEIGISRTKSPETVRHFEDAIRAGYPAVLTLDRAGADQNRSQSLTGIAVQSGRQRDEYPPAVSAEGGVAEIGPTRGRRADVRLIPSADNSSSGASMGAKLGQYCDGQKFRLVGY